jgi:hypothetical protein
MPSLQTTTREHNRGPISPDSDFVWGAEEIGALLGRNPRQTHHLLSKGDIKCARKIGGRWVASRTALLREFGAA